MQEDAERGFRIEPHVLKAAECDSVLAALDDMPRSRAGARHVLSVPAVSALACDARLAGLARSFLGTEPFPYRATLFEKSADSNWLVVWHQDTALPFRERFASDGWGPWSVKDGVLYSHAPASALSRLVALRVHLDPSEHTNGPLRVVPGSHRLGVLSDDAISELVLRSKAVECIVPRGGILAMRPLLLHASGKASSRIPRRVIHIEYADSTTVVPGGELAVA